MSQISIQNLTFRHAGNKDAIFENLNLSFDTNQKIAIIGRNGRGKTTFLELLLGKHQYQGKIIGQVAFEYFPYTVKNVELLAIDIVEELFAENALWKVQKNMQILELDNNILYQKFITLSSGEQCKLLLAVLFAKENTFILLDEPTNHLDIQTRKCVQNFLQRQKGFLLVSHDRDFIDNTVDFILAINRNDIELQKGNFSSWWQNKQNQDAFELEQNKKLKKEIVRLQESAKQAQVWSDRVEKSKNGTKVAGLKVDKGRVGHKAAKMAKRSKVIENRKVQAITQKSSLLKNIERKENVYLNNTDINGELLLSVQNLALFYENRQIFQDINFTVEKGEKVAICGTNGSGKTSLFKAILGKNLEYTGKIYLSSQLKISYISQKIEELEESIFEFADIYQLDKTKFLTLLSKLGFSRVQFDRQINALSAGEKRKILLAKSLCEEANLYLWDEPLNYIDLYTRIQIEEIVKDTSSTFIFIEHDAQFVQNVATKRIYL